VRNRGAGTTAGHRTSASEKGSLIEVTFLGSFPTASFEVDRALPEIAIIGRSNVGKSSLINAILERRAIARISSTPGKTRLLNIFEVESTYYLVDFPGYGYAQVSKTERAGFKKLYRGYFSQREALAGVIWLLDIRHDPSKQDLETADLIAESRVPVLVAATKADKITKHKRAARVKSILGHLNLPEDQCLITSAEKKLGIQELRDAIQEFVGDG
jgi:GTP-binding protein